MRATRFVGFVLLAATARVGAQTVFNPNGTTTYMNPPAQAGGQPGGQGFAPPTAPPVNYQPVLLNSQQLDQVMGRIALYPDALLAQVVMAATAPLEVADAARWASVYPNSTDEQLGQQPWQPAVKTLVRYPDALNLLAGDMAWTQMLGTVYQQQPVEVMGAVQRLRVQAAAVGTLVSTPQQQVVNAGGVIQIVPVQQEVVYVPVYDPVVVYQPVYAVPARDCVTFSVGIRVSRGWDYDVDWRDRAFRPRHGHDHWDGRRWGGYRPPVKYQPGPPGWGRPGIPEYRGPRDGPRGGWDDRRNDDRRDDNRRDNDRRGDDQRDNDRRDDGRRNDDRRGDDRRDNGRIADSPAKPPGARPPQVVIKPAPQPDRRENGGRGGGDKKDDRRDDDRKESRK